MYNFSFQNKNTLLTKKVNISDNIELIWNMIQKFE